MKALVSIIALVICSLTAVSCAQPVAPTATAYPTYTPAPTYTPYPTLAALPTHTPYPTLAPLPTHTPYPTPSALPTHTPYPTLEPLPTHTPYPTPTALPTYTPYPTYTPQPTATLFPTPTLASGYRVYRSNENHYEVAIPIDWTVETDSEGFRIFNFRNAEGVASVIKLGIGRTVPLSTFARLFLSKYEDNLFYALLENNEIDANRWRMRFRLHITGNDCVISEIESVLNRTARGTYVTLTFSCPSYLERRKDDVDKFHESFRVW